MTGKCPLRLTPGSFLQIPAVFGHFWKSDVSDSPAFSPPQLCQLPSGNWDVNPRLCLRALVNTPLVLQGLVSALRDLALCPWAAYLLSALVSPWYTWGTPSHSLNQPGCWGSSRHAHTSLFLRPTRAPFTQWVDLRMPRLGLPKGSEEGTHFLNPH